MNDLDEAGQPAITGSCHVVLIWALCFHKLYFLLLRQPARHAKPQRQCTEGSAQEAYSLQMAPCNAHDGPNFQHSNWNGACPQPPKLASFYKLLLSSCIIWAAIPDWGRETQATHDTWM